MESYNVNSSLAAEISTSLQTVAKRSQNKQIASARQAGRFPFCRLVSNPNWLWFYLALFISCCSIMLGVAAAEQPKLTQNREAAVMAAQKQQLKQAAAQKNKRVFYIPKHWTDAASGFAIGGIDPIAYFEEGRMQWGEEEFEHFWRGTAWRFKTEGNMNAFRRSPSLYAPVFAGYDAYALANGILTEGKPALWAIVEGRLYLFQNPVNRHLWMEEGEKLKAKVTANWRELSSDIPRYKLIISQ